MNGSRHLGGADGSAVFPLCLGGNVFGWTADERESFAVLDAYAEAGGNFIDTADFYAAWAPGNRGGESETILGRWMKARGVRARMVVATKVGKLAGRKGLAPATIRAAVDDSLRRLQTDCIDLYYAHADDPTTPLAEVVDAFDALVRAGKVRAVGLSNFTAARVAEALALARARGKTPIVAVQDHYHLLKREVYEGELARLCTTEGLAFLPYYAVAQGFLTGKYRPGQVVAGVRSDSARAYADARGWRMLAALDRIAARHRVAVAAVALAWLLAQPGVVAPIASARTPAQVMELVAAATLRLDSAELAELTAL